jgi:hypothetical protein
MNLSVLAGKGICPMCGGDPHPIEKLYECPMVKSYSCWGENGGWEITKYDENDVEIEFED